MAQSECYKTLKEWAPLTDLLNKVPTKVKSGFFGKDITITCFDVLPEFIAIGTNVGHIYWYDRKKTSLKRYHLDRPNKRVTCIKVVSTVDYMIAAGSTDGVVNIFQIPKVVPDSVPEHLKPKGKMAHRYTADTTQGSITAIEWSKNGMKMFSGDVRGTVVETDLDFVMCTCKSCEILNEAYEVVQLSYYPQKLLVSTTYRTIICHRTHRWIVHQVGRRDRKILGSFGGVLWKKGLRDTDIVMYCARPGLRLWVADTDGDVHKTLLFRDLVQKECPEVPIINPIPQWLEDRKPTKEVSFGVLLPFAEKFLVTFCNDVIYILDADNMTVIGAMTRFRSVLSVQICNDEIFILEGGRSITRVAYTPEQNAFNVGSTSSAAGPSRPSSSQGSQHQPRNILPMGGETKVGDSTVYENYELPAPAEEAVESPVRTERESDKRFDHIGEQPYGEAIASKPQSRRKKNPMTTSKMSLSTDPDDSEIQAKKPALRYAQGYVRDERNPEAKQTDIELKERTLAKMLKLEPIKLPAITPETTETPTTEESTDIKLPVTTPETTETPTTEEGTVAEPERGNSPEYLDYRPQISPLPPIVAIPKEWNIPMIQLYTENEPARSETESNDWEML